LPELDSNRRHVESEVNSGEISARAEFIGIAGELIYIVSAAFDVDVSSRDDLK